MKGELRGLRGISVHYVPADTPRNLPDVAQVIAAFGIHLPGECDFDEIRDLSQVTPDVDRTNVGIECDGIHCVNFTPEPVIHILIDVIFPQI